MNLAMVMAFLVTMTMATISVEALRLDLGLPGGGRVSYRDGLLRIQPPPSPNDEDASASASSRFQVPWDQALERNQKQNILPIEHKLTPTKGYGAFYAGADPLPRGSFLGFYEGQLVRSRDALEDLHARRKQELLESGNEEDASKVGDYVLSLDGGVHFLDGFHLRYRGGGEDDDQQPFSLAHLNHADKGDPSCNVVRELVYLPDELEFLPASETTESPFWLGGGGDANPGDTNYYPRNLPRVAFFAAREISRGEELAFDYGTNFWKRTTE